MKFNVKTRIKIKGFIPSTIIPRNGPIKKLQIIKNGDSFSLYSSRCKGVNIPRNICLNSDDFVAIGLYLAEGTTYCNINNKTKHSGEIAFAISHPNCISLVCKLLNKFKISTKS